jgi:hypothetical protein
VEPTDLIERFAQIDDSEKNKVVRKAGSKGEGEGVREKGNEGVRE